MQLKTLVAAISPRQIIGPVDRVVESIAYDSRRVQRNGLFVALRGEKSDGHQFIEQAVEKGATVIVTEHEVQSPRATCVVVENTRSALADLAATFYEHPARRLKLAAVTGTNGKTTTTFLLKHILEKAGLRCGLLGTVRYEIADRVLPAVRTTPESLDVQELLSQMVNAGCKAAAMEVSSHALTQDRVRGIEWDVAVFTNLTQDHLDFHGTMENYFEAKAALFTGLAEQKAKKSAKAVINLDDRYGAQLVDRLDGDVRRPQQLGAHDARKDAAVGGRGHEPAALDDEDVAAAGFKRCQVTLGHAGIARQDAPRHAAASADVAHALADRREVGRVGLAPRVGGKRLARRRFGAHGRRPARVSHPDGSGPYLHFIASCV